MIEWSALVLGGVCAVIWSFVLFDRLVRSGRLQRKDRLDMQSRASAANWIIVIAWAFGVLPSLLGLLQAGRHGDEFSTTTLVLTGDPARLASVLSALLVFVCFRVIFIYFHVPPLAGVWRLAAFLAPWLAIELIAGANAGYFTGRQFVFYPLIAVTLWLAAPPIGVARTVGALTGFTAGLSIVLALVSKLGLVNAGPAGMAKSIVGHSSLLLAGPYSSSNSLALVLTLGTPCVLLFRSLRWRIATLSVIGVALLWTAGRTSIIAASVGIITWLVVAASVRHGRNLGLVIAGFGLALVSLTPLLERNPRGFTDRGAIWLQSLSTWRHQDLWFGGGPQFYERSNATFPLLPFKVVAGHNLVVDTLARGGVIALIALAVWIIVLLVRALRLSHLHPFPLAFVVTLIYVSWLEVPLSLANLGYLGYVCWLPLGLICFGRSSPEALALDPLPARVAADPQLLAHSLA
jgi:hypothetical protein